MANKFSAEKIQLMLDLYDKYGTYAAVAKEIGSTAATVSKYIKEAKKNISFVEYNGIVPVETEISILNFSELTPEQKQSYERMLAEL